MSTLVIDRVHRGPALSGNGGYSSGLLAEALGGGRDGAVQVTLRLPPPLERPLAVSETDGVARLTEGPALVAEAVRVDDIEVDLAPVPLEAAVAAAVGYPGFRDHPFPGCFTCGTDRSAGDGLRIFSGPTGTPGVFAAPWDTSEVTDLGVPVVWAALDCPSGWAADIEGRPSVLGRMAATIKAVPEPGPTLVVVSRFLGADGRKTFAASALFDGDRCLARALTTWIQVDPAAFNG